MSTGLLFLKPATRRVASLLVRGTLLDRRSYPLEYRSKQGTTGPRTLLAWAVAILISGAASLPAQEPDSEPNFVLPPVDQLGVALPPPENGDKDEEKEEKNFELPPLPPRVNGSLEMSIPPINENDTGGYLDLFPKPGETIPPIFSPEDVNISPQLQSSIFAVPNPSQPAPDPWIVLFPDRSADRFHLPESFPSTAHRAPIPIEPPPLKVRIEKIHFRGNTAFSDAKLLRLVSDLAGREVTSEDLEAARNALTLHYVDAGYLNSGARLPDQDLENGELTFELVEGKLTRVEVIDPKRRDESGREILADSEDLKPPTFWERLRGFSLKRGKRYLRKRYVEQRLKEIREDSILDADRIKEKLQILQTNPNVKKINAELKPDLNPGEAYLEIILEEETEPFHAGIDIHNSRAPGVGAEQIEPWIRHDNLTGFSDTLSMSYGLLDRGFDEFNIGNSENFSIAYRIPFTRKDTEFFTSYQRNNFGVIEEPFDLIDLTGESEALRIGVRQPVNETLEKSFSVSAMVDFKESQTYLFGEPFTLTPGAVDGRIDLSVFRFEQDYVERSRNKVNALRSTFSFGFDKLDELPPGADRNGSFLSWIGQAQHLRRLGGDDSNIQMILRGVLQYSDDPLLAPEQFSVGGSSTVRGFRENQLVRDMGAIGSLEFRIPLVEGTESQFPNLTLAPFVDYGTGWNRGVGEVRRRDLRELTSFGLGLLYHDPNDKVDAQVYWGRGIEDFDTAETDLQDLGIHFRISVKAF